MPVRGLPNVDEGKRERYERSIDPRPGDLLAFGIEEGEMRIFFVGEEVDEVQRLGN